MTGGGGLQGAGGRSLCLHFDPALVSFGSQLEEVMMMSSFLRKGS